MAVQTRSRVPWRIVGWGGAVALLAAPFLAMRVGNVDVNWSLGDFIAAALMLAVVGGAFELVVKASGSWAYRGGVVLALAGALLTTWVNLAVGIVGSENNPANLWFFGALAIGLSGAVVARFRARGMSVVMLVTAVALWLAFAIAVLSRTDEPYVRHSVEFAGTSIFALILLGSALLFRKAART